MAVLGAGREAREDQDRRIVCAHGRIIRDVPRSSGDRRARPRRPSWNRHPSRHPRTTHRPTRRTRTTSRRTTNPRSRLRPSTAAWTCGHSRSSRTPSPCSAPPPDGGRTCSGPSPQTSHPVGPGLGHAVEHLEEMTVRALVLIDRHRRARLAGVPPRGSLARAWLAAPPRLRARRARGRRAPPAHAIVIGTRPAERSRARRRRASSTSMFDDPMRVARGNAAVRNEDERARCSAGGPFVTAVAHARGPAAAEPARRQLHRALEHRLRRRPQRGRRDRLRDRRRQRGRRTACSARRRR